MAIEIADLPIENVTNDQRVLNMAMLCVTELQNILHLGMSENGVYPQV